MAIHTQKISNNPLLPSVAREVEIQTAIINDNAKAIDIYYIVKSELNGLDISNTLNPSFPVWTISNSQRIMIRDEKTFKPIPNPEYDPEIEGSEEFMMEYAYDYITYLMFVKRVDLITLLTSYIQERDEDGGFNILK